MKNLFLALSAALLLASCVGGNSSSKSSSADAAQTKSAAEAKNYTIVELLDSADSNVNQLVTVRGSVTHTCKHSGRRCFIVGDDASVSFRVEAKGEIGGFNRELTGSELAITGYLRESRLSKEYIDQKEDEAKEKLGKGGAAAESCGTELKNIESIRAWMKKNNKDYYSTYYMDGESYEVVE